VLILAHLILKTILWAKYYSYAHFTDEDTESQEKIKLTKITLWGSSSMHIWT